MPRLSPSRVAPARRQDNFCTPPRSSPERTKTTLKAKKRKASDADSSSSSAAAAPLAMPTLSVDQVATSFERVSLFVKHVLNRRAEPVLDADRNQAHAYIVSGPVISHFEFPRDKHCRLSRASKKRYSMVEIVENCISDIHLLLKALAMEELQDAPITKAMRLAAKEDSLNFSARFPPSTFSSSSSNSSSSSSSSVQDVGYEAIAHCLYAVFSTDHARLIGCHLARRAYADGQGSFFRFGETLALLGNKRQLRSASSKDLTFNDGLPVETVLKIVRVCLEGLRDPSTAESHLFPKAQVFELRQRFVRQVLVGNSVLAIIARLFQHKSSFVEANLSSLRHDALFVFDRVLRDALHPSAGDFLDCFIAVDKNDGVLHMVAAAMNKFSSLLYTLTSTAESVLMKPLAVFETWRACNIVCSLLRGARVHAKKGLVSKVLSAMTKKQFVDAVDEVMFELVKLLHPGSARFNLKLQAVVAHNAQNAHDVPVPTISHLLEGCLNVIVTLCEVAPRKGYRLLEKVTATARSGEDPLMLETVLSALNKQHLKFSARIAILKFLNFVVYLGTRNRCIEEKESGTPSRMVVRRSRSGGNGGGGGGGGANTANSSPLKKRALNCGSLLGDLEENLPKLHSKLERCLRRYGAPRPLCSGSDACPTAGSVEAGLDGDLLGPVAGAAGLGVSHRYQELELHVVELVVSLTGCFSASRRWVVDEKELFYGLLSRRQTAGAMCLVLSNCVSDKVCLRDLPLRGGVWKPLLQGVFQPLCALASLPPRPASTPKEKQRLQRQVSQDRALVCTAVHLLRRLCNKRRFCHGSVGHTCAVLNLTELHSLLPTLNPMFLRRIVNPSSSSSSSSSSRLSAPARSLASEASVCAASTASAPSSPAPSNAAPPSCAAEWEAWLASEFEKFSERIFAEE